MLNRKHAAFDRDSADGAHAASGAAKLVLGRREALFHARGPAPSVYEVIDGALMIYRLLADGRRQIVDLALPGSVCGFSCDGAHECSC